eukprot:scaffold139_cov246-Pinguiococcus_pyrenoidosus.AAC.12
MHVLSVSRLIRRRPCSQRKPCRRAPRSIHGAFSSHRASLCPASSAAADLGPSPVSSAQLVAFCVPRRLLGFPHLRPDPLADHVHQPTSGRTQPGRSCEAPRHQARLPHRECQGYWRCRHVGRQCHPRGRISFRRKCCVVQPRPYSDSVSDAMVEGSSCMTRGPKARAAEEEALYPKKPPGNAESAAADAWLRRAGRPKIQQPRILSSGTGYTNTLKLLQKRHQSRDVAMGSISGSRQRRHRLEA